MAKQLLHVYWYVNRNTSYLSSLVEHKEFCMYRIKPETANGWTTIKRNSTATDYGSPHPLGLDGWSARSNSTLYSITQVRNSRQVMKTD
jgi:hypothetical protein